MANDETRDSKDDQSEEEGEEQRAAAGTRLSATEIYENVRVAAEEEMQRTTASLFWSSLAAGLTIGFSFLAAAYLASLVRPEAKNAAASVGYPLGFIFVVLARSQLFTENTLEPVIPVLHSPSRESWGRLARLWVVVLLGNLVGALAFGIVLARSEVVPPQLTQSMIDIGNKAVEGGFASVLYKGIFAGWLIALMAWLVASTRQTGAQVLLVWLTTAPISALGFRHSIAGAVEVFFLATRGEIQWSTALFGFELPAVLGNAIGGVLLVALLNHAQVAAERRKRATA